MKISANWIRDFVSPTASDRDVAEALTVSGIAIEGYFGEGADQTWEAEITTNRVDAMNHYGVAREVSAIYDLDLAPIAPKVAESGPANVSIAIDDAEGCARYTARIVRGVKIAPAPAKIAHRLELIDQRSISNVADASNYVLNEIGHPTHAFDLDKLEGGKIIVRRARAGETHHHARWRRAQALARRPRHRRRRKARRSRRSHGRRSDDDYRCHAQRAHRIRVVRSGLHPPHRAPPRHAHRRLAPLRARSRLRHHLAGLRPRCGADRRLAPAARSPRRSTWWRAPSRSRALRWPPAKSSASSAWRFLPRRSPASWAASVSASKAGGAFKPRWRVERPEFTVTVPTWRLDVEREIDLIEEVARIYSYLKIPSTLPSFSGGVVELPNARKQAALRGRLLALGYNESLSSTFIPQEDARSFRCNAEPVRIANPLSEEASFMRTSLVPGLLSQIAYNLNRGNADVRLFEAGHVYAMQGEAVDEHNSLAFAATGAARDPGVHGKPEPLTFFHLKGDIEQLLAAFDFDTSDGRRRNPSTARCLRGCIPAAPHARSF